MDEQRGKEGRASGQRTPGREDDLPTDRLHRRQAENPGRMAEEMRGRIAEEDQPGNQSESSLHAA